MEKPQRMSSILDSSSSSSSSSSQSPDTMQSTSHSAIAENDHMINNTTITTDSANSTSDPNRTDPSSSMGITNNKFDANNASAAAAAAAAAVADDDDLNTDTNENGAKKDDSMFECNICLDTAKEAVVSMCGHLFCWPCLHQWLETRPTRQLCPVCKAAISKEKVIPLYGRGSTKEEDPRSKVPPRPAGQRTEPEPNTTFQGFGFGDGGFQMSLGIGAFPFGIFTSTFNFGTNLRSQNPSTTVQLDEDQFLSKAFLWVTVIFLAWLVWA